MTTIEQAYLANYGPPPDGEISLEVWAFVHAQYKRPTSIGSFYTFAALVEERHRKALAMERKRATAAPEFLDIA